MTSGYSNSTNFEEWVSKTRPSSCWSSTKTKKLTQMYTSRHYLAGIVSISSMKTYFMLFHCFFAKIPCTHWHTHRHRHIHKQKDRHTSGKYHLCNRLPGHIKRSNSLSCLSRGTQYNQVQHIITLIDPSSKTPSTLFGLLREIKKDCQVNKCRYLKRPKYKIPK